MEQARIVLQNELFKRCKKNPAYSLRAFAQHLGIPVSSLSSIMSGARSPSKKNWVKIKTHLRLDDSTIGTSQIDFKKKDLHWQDIETDVFLAISQWYHFAILELIKIHKGKVSPALIVDRLSIKNFEAQAALERLLRLKLITIDETGRYADVNGGYASYFNGKDTSDAHKALMVQLLGLAQEKIMSVPLKLRDYSSTTVSLNLTQLSHAKKLLKKYRRELTAEMETNPNPNAVYEFTMCLYPLTKLKKK